MNVWLLKDGEPFFFEKGERSMRTGSLATQLAQEGHSVCWWTSRVDHSSKTYRKQYEDVHEVSNLLKVYFLKSSGYKKNMSLSRILHFRSISREFRKRSQKETCPDIIVGSMPSPELCFAGFLYAKKMNIPFIIDIRDPWPDIFSGYFPSIFKILLFPIIFYYRRKIKRITRGADGITAVSNSQLNWGLKYSNRSYDQDRDKLLYIGYENRSGSKIKKNIQEFSEKSPLTCMYITSWGSSYDAETLVKTARILKKEVGQKILIIATGDGESREARMEEAKELDNINFTGFISSEEMDSHLIRSHIGLVLMKGGITRYWIGNKIGEYIAHSLAIVNNVDAEVAEVIQNNNIGVNVKPENPESVAKALISYLNSPSVLLDHVENSSKLFKEAFDRKQNSKDYIEYLKRICNRKIH